MAASKIHPKKAKTASPTVAARPAEEQRPGSVRISITISADDYADLKTLAGQKRVSIAWVARDALQHYLKNVEPLFRS